MVRRHVGIAVALATGMALGYAVRPSAQATIPNNVSFQIESAGSDRVRVSFGSLNGAKQNMEAARFDLTLLSDILVVTPSPDGTFQTGTGAPIQRADRHAFRVPTPQPR